MKRILKRLFKNANFTTMFEMGIMGVDPPSLYDYCQKEHGAELKVQAGRGGLVVMVKDGKILDNKEISNLLK